MYIDAPVDSECLEDNTSTVTAQKATQQAICPKKNAREPEMSYFTVVLHPDANHRSLSPKYMYIDAPFDSECLKCYVTTNIVVH